MSGFLLRPVQEAERAALLDLWVEAWREVFPAIAAAARRDWFDTYLRGLEADGAVTLVALDDTPAGFINFHPVTGYVDQIAIAPARQGQGVATALLAAAKRACPQGLTLKVNQQNPRALRFYQREGFVISGEGVSAGSGLALWEMGWKSPAALRKGSGTSTSQSAARPLLQSFKMLIQHHDFNLAVAVQLLEDELEIVAHGADGDGHPLRHLRQLKSGSNQTGDPAFRRSQPKGSGNGAARLGGNFNGSGVRADNHNRTGPVENGW